MFFFLSEDSVFDILGEVILIDINFRIFFPCERGHLVSSEHTGAFCKFYLRQHENTERMPEGEDREPQHAVFGAKGRRKTNFTLLATFTEPN